MSATTSPTTDFTTTGRELIELAGSLETREAWEAGWTQPEHALGEYEDECWSAATMYYVDDFEAEFGAYVAGLGFRPAMIMAAGTSTTDDGRYANGYAMLGSPDMQVAIAIAGSTEVRPAANPQSMILEFMVKDVDMAWAEATSRGIVGTRAPWEDGMRRAELTLPSGIVVSLWQIAR